MARLRVANVLTTSSTGAFSDGLHSASTMLAPYLPSLTRRVAALPAHALLMTFWYGPSTEGTGTQARDMPSGNCSSTRVVISNVRQAPGCGSNGSCWAKLKRGRDPTTDAATPACRNDRLRMVTSGDR